MKEIRYTHPNIEESIERDVDSRDRREYEKPLFKLVEKMTFPFDAIKKHAKDKESKYVCRQCSSCHGCR